MLILSRMEVSWFSKNGLRRAIIINCKFCPPGQVQASVQQIDLKLNEKYLYRRLGSCSEIFRRQTEAFFVTNRTSLHPEASGTRSVLGDMCKFNVHLPAHCSLRQTCIWTSCFGFSTVIGSLKFRARFLPQTNLVLPFLLYLHLG